jgi:hypothetical protein
LLLGVERPTMHAPRPVRAIRDDPTPEESVTVLLRLGDADEENGADAPAVVAAVESLGGELDAELEFDTLRVVVPEAGVADLCDRDDLAAIETAATLEIGAGDAGEDVELPDE